MRNLLLAASLLLSSLQSSRAEAEFPLELEQALAARRAIRTGEVAYRIDDRGRGLNRPFVARFTQTEQLVRSGEYADPMGTEGVATLVTSSERWDRLTPSPLFAFVTEFRDVKSGIPNPLSLGLEPWTSTQTVEGTWLSGDHALGATWSRRFAEDLCVISAELGEDRFEWWLDPEKDYQPVRSAHFRAGEWIEETRCELRQFGPIWMPGRVEILDARHAGGVEPREIYTIEHAEFNGANHPSKLTPAHLGYGAGTNVHYVDHGSGPREIRMWTGAEIVSQERYFELQAEGKIRPSEAVEAEVARLLQKNPMTPARIASGLLIRIPFESEWEEYTREFIQRFSLDEGQSNSARRILADCQQRADRYLATHKSEFDDLEQRRKKAAVNPELDNAALGEIMREIKRLGEPIEHIFDHELKPRLEKLPTATQRATAEKVPPAKLTVTKPAP